LHSTPWQETAALRDFNPAYDRCGSEAEKLDLNSMSALPPIWLHLSLPPK